MMRSSQEIATALAQQDRRALSRALSWVEAGDPRGLQLAAEQTARGQYVLGITGPPGAGKSTLTDRLIACIRERGETVAVLAIDPSSPISGGAILGDRIRMMRHTHDGGVYVRSMASRGQLGGLSSAVPAALRILAGFGFDRLIVETVGVGQVELDVARTADCAVVVIAPGFGDHIQASKAGLIEVADVFVINKADRPGADEAVADLTMAIDLGQPHGWRPAVIPCAAETGSGIGEVWAALEAFRMFQESQDVLEARRRDRRLSQLRSALGALVQRRVDAFVEDAGNAEILAAVADGTVNATDAAERMFDHLCSASM